ncbi:Carbohydrate binding domain CBM49 [Dillenia turbinata]|uniref:cellulase n=1 Tax=Dillenia turbinata TaxID=194707 RepID=A0AAN8Z5L3_9MAGN
MKRVIAWMLLFLVVGSEATATFNYGEALVKTLMFFEAQRSGKLPLNRTVKWRGDSGLSVGFLQGVDLVGGYYDAGDHVKFGLPMAFTVTMLSWAAIEYEREIAGVEQLSNTLDAIKWGTDYFIKAHPQPNVLWGQVGDGQSDHHCWERAEDMTTPRTAYRLDQAHPGSDLAGETAAAMAAASMAFKQFDDSYSNLLLLHAKQLFLFADRFRGLYIDSIQSAQSFYMSSGYGDELLWAATWLYRATGDQYYLQYVIDNAESLGGTGGAMKEFSWDNKYAGVQMLLSKVKFTKQFGSALFTKFEEGNLESFLQVLLEGSGGRYTVVMKQYQDKADYFACACLQKNSGYNVDLTPGSCFADSTRHPCPNRYVMSHIYAMLMNNFCYMHMFVYMCANGTTCMCRSRPDGQVQPQDLFNFAKSQADYILGGNPQSMSYMVGYGNNYPTHRRASIASISVLQTFVACIQGLETWYLQKEGNPNNDGFSDDRSNYEETEPTISGTTPLVGLFAKLQSASKIEGYNLQFSTGPDQKRPGYHKQVSPTPYTNSGEKSADVPVELLHSITNTWTVGPATYYRHMVIIKNTSKKPITNLKLKIEYLSGSLWGLTPTAQKNVYELPQQLKVLNPGAECTFVYVQGGPQAKVSVLSYNQH